jgi:hypothetical protein
MEELHRKGLANHPDPKSCVVYCRKAAIEALTGAHAGRVLSSEIRPFQSADGVGQPEGHTRGGARASRQGTLRSRRPRHVWKLHAREPGDPRGARQRVDGPGGEGDEL